MELEGLRARLRDVLDVDAELARFAAERGTAGTADLEAFVADLRARDRISGGMLCAIYAGLPLRLPTLADLRAEPDHAVVPVAQALAAAAPEARTVIPALGEARAAPPMPPGAATATDRYQLLGRIGAGAMGEVQIARDRALGRIVAYKRVVAELSGHGAVATRFFAEAQITSQLDHPNVVSIYDVALTDGRASGYAMKLVEGRTLTSLLEAHRAALVAGDRAGEPARLAERLRIFLAVCDAIGFAHAKGVLHRDLKPDNLMIGSYSQVYVMDWGICRIIGTADETADEIIERLGASAQHGRTMYGAIIGTPGYMSPEQAAGKVPELDGRSDQYALGLILYELVALRPANPGATLQESLAAATSGTKAPLGHRVHGAPISRDLAAVIDKATARAPGDRYRDVAALAADVRAYLRGDPVSARRDNPIERAMRWIGRHKGATLTALLAVLLLGAGATIVELIVSGQRVAAADAHARAIEELQLAVARRGHAIDAELFRYQEQIARLSGRVAEVMAGAPVATRAYLAADYDGGQGPPDLAPAAHYRADGAVARASFEHVVIKLSPGVDPAAVADDVARLASLRPAFTELMLGTASTPIAPADARRAILDVGVPALRTFITLASGVHASYPGMGGYAPGYDGRHRPKYTLAAGRPPGVITWGNPIADRHGQGAVLAASTAIAGPDGAIVGVTGMEMTFDWLEAHLVPMSEPYVDAAFLVDARGSVIVSVGGRDARPPVAAPRDDEDATLPLAALPYPEVRAAIAGGVQAAALHDHVTIEIDGARKHIAITPIASLGWWYVVVADEARLLSQRL
ncbi:MAG: protein kinase [Deltaproteobacteria bacterium]|nr:protein kinase [Deltaproteobacteria bacterium]